MTTGAILLLWLIALSQVAQAQFVHPGILRTQAQLDLIKSNIQSGQEPWKTSLQKVYTEGYSAGTTNVYTPFVAPGATEVWRDPATGAYTNLVSWQRDNHAAYVQAMLWAVTGNTQNRDNAIAIFDAWSSLQSLHGGDMMLEVGDAQIYMAAEILAYAKYNGVGSGWTGKALWQDKFRNIFRPWLLDLAGANWGTGAIRGRIAIDVFLDDQADFDKTVAAYKHPFFAVQEGLFGGWGWQCAFLNSCLDIGGQNVETVRDQAHTQKEMFEMAHICETAWNQGVDLYSYKGNRLLNGFEYTCSLNLSNSIPFSTFYTFDRNGSGNTSPGAGNIGQFSADTFELICNHYITRQGMAAPYTEQVAQMLRPSGEDTLFYYSGTPDPTGLGTVASVNLKSQGGTEGCYVPFGQVKVVWTPAANATGYNIKRATTSGGPYTTVAANIPWNFAWYDGGVTAGVTYYYVVSALNGSESPNSPESSITLEGPLPSPWGSQDIGVSSSSTFSVFNPVPTVNTVCTNGSAYWAANGVNGAYTYSANVYTIAGTGGDIWNTGDVFRFAYQTMSGDGTIVARVIGREGIQYWCKNGLMMRQDLTAGSKNVLMCLSANNGAQHQSRSSAGGASATQKNDSKYLGPYWLKLTRSGNTFTSFISNDGQDWTNFSSVTIAMTDPIYVGLASSSANASQINYASFDNVTTPNSLPPAAPTGLSATAVSSSQINLSWTASSGATSYNVKRATVSGGPYTTVATGVTATTYNDTGLAASTAFYYVVSAVNSGGESANSAQASATTQAPPPPPAPTGLTATAVSSSQINLSWTSSSGATSYNVKRATVSGGPYTTVATGVTATTYNDTGLAASTTYYYVVSADNSGGESANSAQDSATTQANPPPAAPTGLTVTAGNTEVALSWTASSGATSYNVKRATVSGGPYTTITNVGTTSCTDTGLSNGTTYYYVVSALNSDGESANSTQASATPVASGLPAPWLTEDVGAVAASGSASHNSGTFTVVGSGADIQGSADEFRYAYQPASGDCTIIARVASLQNTHAWAKAGVMIRETLAAGSANAFVGVTPGNGVTWQNRSSTGGGTSYNNTSGLAAPYWVKLVRSGNTFTGYRSADGVAWTQQGTASITMGASVYIGMAVTSHADGTLCTATFDNVTAPNWPPAVPPSAPTGLTATGGDAQVALTWNASSGATSYNVKRATASGGPYTTITNVGTTSFTDTGLANGTTYYYVASAVNGAGESADSTEASATPTLAAPAFVAAGTIASGTGSITPALPSGIATGDVLLLFVETANETVSISNPNGGTWTQVTGSPQGTGTAASSSATRLTVFWSRHNGTQGAPTVSDSGNHQIGRMIAIRGAAAFGNPWDVTAGGVEATADTSGSIPGATTTVANTLVVVAVAGSLPDSNGTSNFSGWSNASLANLTERTDDTRSSGNGGALGIATGEKTAAGPYGNTAVTHASSAVKGMISIAIRN